MEDIFWVAKISNIYLGCLKFLIFFGVNGRCLARAYIRRKTESTPLGFVHQFKPIPVKCIQVGFCPSGFFVPVDFCPSGLLSSGLLC